MLQSDKAGRRGETEDRTLGHDISQPSHRVRPGGGGGLLPPPRVLAEAGRRGGADLVLAGRGLRAGAQCAACRAAGAGQVGAGAVLLSPHLTLSLQV